MKTTKWRDLVAAREAEDPEYAAERERRRGRVLADYAELKKRLPDLRKARELTQVELAKRLEVSQGQISKLEGQADMYLSTLAGYVAALGGELKLVAVFDGQEIPISLPTLEPEPAAQPERDLTPV